MSLTSFLDLSTPSLLKNSVRLQEICCFIEQKTLPKLKTTEIHYL